MKKPIAAVAVSCLLAASAARADLLDWNGLTQYQQPNMHYGQIALHPYYRLSEMYDSNIFLVPRDQPGGQVGGGIRSSWITKNDLGLETKIPLWQLNSLSLGYDFESDIYTTLPSVNNTINQALHADFVRDGAQGMTYKAGDQYINTTDQAFSELVQRARRWMNRAYASVDYAPKNGLLAGGIDVDQQTDKYLDPTLASELNRYQEDGGFNVGYMVQPKTKAYVSYHREVIHYTVNPSVGVPEKDSKSHIVTAGVTGQLTPKVSGQVEAGLDYRQNDVAPVSGAKRVNQTPTVLTKLTYDPDPLTIFVLTLTRTFEETIDVNNAFYYSNRASLEIDRKFPYKFKAGINLVAGRDQYLNAQTFGTVTANRRDNRYQGGAFIEYDIQSWLSTGVSYLYSEDASTLSGQFDYQDSRVTWNASLTF